MFFFLLFVSTPTVGGWQKPLAIFPLNIVPSLNHDIITQLDVAGQEKGEMNEGIFINVIENGFTSIEVKGRIFGGF
jgi:hypothetical protein